jgi:hypothetical protein
LHDNAHKAFFQVDLFCKRVEHATVFVKHAGYRNQNERISQ